MAHPLSGWLFRQPYILLLLAPFFWGGNAVAGKLAVGAVPPMALGSLRWALASLILIVLAHRHVRQDWARIRKSIVLLFFMGAFGFGTFNLLLYNALHYTSTINVTIEQAAIPMIIMLGNFLIYREKIGWLQMVGLVISLLGVAITVTHGDLAILWTLSINFGDVLMLIAALCYAAYSITLRKKPAIHWLSFLTILALAAFAASLVGLATEMSKGITFTPSMTGFALIVFLAIFPSILAQLCYARGVELVGANRAGLFINFVPVFGALLAVILLGEVFQLYHFLGLTCVFAGIAMSEYQAHQKKRAAKPA